MAYMQKNNPKKTTKPKKDFIGGLISGFSKLSKDIQTGFDVAAKSRAKKRSQRFNKPQSINKPKKKSLVQMLRAGHKRRKLGN